MDADAEITEAYDYGSDDSFGLYDLAAALDEDFTTQTFDSDQEPADPVPSGSSSPVPYETSMDHGLTAAFDEGFNPFDLNDSEEPTSPSGANTPPLRYSSPEPYNYASDDDDNDSAGSLFDMAEEFDEDLMPVNPFEKSTDPASPTGTNMSYPLASSSSAIIAPSRRTRSPVPPSPRLALAPRAGPTWRRNFMASQSTVPAQTRSPAPPPPQLALSTRGGPTWQRSLMASDPILPTQTRSYASPFPRRAPTTRSGSNRQRIMMSSEPLGPPPVYTSRTQPLCVVCNVKPAYNDGRRAFPTCGNTCARTLEAAKKTTRSGAYYPPHIPAVPNDRRPSASSSLDWYDEPRRQNPVKMCLVCRVRPRCQTNRKTFPTCGLTCAAKYSMPPVPAVTASVGPCVVCLVGTCPDSRYVTCGPICTENLCYAGGANPSLCDYCHRQPKLAGQNQCGDACKAGARLACLMCKSRPKHRHYHLCGKTCKEIATKQTPLILEVPKGHVTYEMVVNKFSNSWMFRNTRIPIVQRVYKIIESSSFLEPYEKYKKAVGNEVFRYHGTTRKCTLGAPGNTQLCSNTACPLCSILRTSFKTSLANPRGAFGAGVYTSSASNKAHSYTDAGAGALLLTKVVLGKVRKVAAFKEVVTCPPGFHSVVFERHNDCLNETIVYSDDAIRPVFLIMF